MKCESCIPAVNAEVEHSSVLTLLLPEHTSQVCPMKNIVRGKRVEIQSLC